MRKFILIGILSLPGFVYGAVIPPLSTVSSVPLNTSQYSRGTSTTTITDGYGRQITIGPLYKINSSSSTAIAVSTLCAFGVGGSTYAINAPPSGSHLRVYYISASNSGATSALVGWRETAGDTYYGTVNFPVYLPQNGVFAHNLKPGYWDVSDGMGVCVYSSAAGNVYWTIEYEVVKN